MLAVAVTILFLHPSHLLVAAAVVSSPLALTVLVAALVAARRMALTPAHIAEVLAQQAKVLEVVTSKAQVTRKGAAVVALVRKVLMRLALLMKPQRVAMVLLPASLAQA